MVKKRDRKKFKKTNVVTLRSDIVDVGCGYCNVSELIVSMRISTNEMIVICPECKTILLHAPHIDVKRLVDQLDGPTIKIED